MLDRRQFTFAALVTLISSSAAAETIPEVQPQLPSSPATLVPVYRAKRKGNEVQIDVSIRNAGTDAVDLLVAYGSQPAPRLTATLADGAVLEQLVEVGRRDLMSRIGPAPRYAPVAAGESVTVATYRFAYSGSDSVVDVAIEVSTGQFPFALPTQRLTLARTAS